MSDLAQAAYDAYCASAGGVSLVSGDQLPAFGDLPLQIQAAWDAAAQAVARELTAVNFIPTGYQGPAQHTYSKFCDGFHEPGQCPMASGG